MRMWNVPPSDMCRRHLLAEHCEMHMFLGSLQKGKNLQGYITKGLVELDKLKFRHDELVKEMGIRGYLHKTPMAYYMLLKARQGGLGKVDIELSKKTLVERCPECALKMIQATLAQNIFGMNRTKGLLGSNEGWKGAKL